MDEILSVLIVPIGLVLFLALFLMKSNEKHKKENHIICPNQNCKYVGKGERDGSTSGCLFIILLFLGIIPGILYLIFAGKKGMICPKCGCRIR